MPVDEHLLNRLIAEANNLGVISYDIETFVDEPFFEGGRFAPNTIIIGDTNISIQQGQEPIIVKQDKQSRMNRDVRTQLLSRSLHEIMEKFSGSGNRVATALVKLNQHGYFQDSTRNVTINKAKEMTYCPAGKPTILGESFKWVAKTRQAGKYGKVIKKLLAEQIPNMKVHDVEIEDLVNGIKSELADGHFHIVQGEEIRYWYHEDRFHPSILESKNSLSSSCMRHPRCQDYLGIYTNNDIVKMVVCTKNDKLVGRALLWNDTWMDRIYGPDHIVKLFKEYARENGYYHKFEQSYCNRTQWINPDTGFVENINMSWELNTKFDEYPYVDTFCWMVDGKLSNYHTGEGDVELNCTEGGWVGSDDDDDNDVYDDIADDYIHEDSAVYVPTRDINTHVDNCKYDYHREEWVYEDDAVYVERNNEYYYEADCTWCDGTEEYVHNSFHDTFTCDYDNKVYPCEDDILVEIDDVCVSSFNLDEWYEVNEEYEYVSEIGEYRKTSWLEDNDFHWIDGEYEWVSLSTLESNPDQYEYNEQDNCWYKIN